MLPRLFLSGGPVTRERHGAEGSPFQMPARLADGLGLESGLGAAYTAPFAPSSDELSPKNSVPPRPAPGREPDLGCKSTADSAIALRQNLTLER